MNIAANTCQLGFESLLTDAEGANRARRFKQETAHLPGSIDEAVPYMRFLIRQHHAAMLDANVENAMALREEASKLASKLNRGEPGIIASDDAPGCVLARLTAAAADAVPLWGQCGEFTVSVDGMAVRIEMDGFFGIGAWFLYWPGFAAHAVDWDKPFISDTGYRSFLGCGAEPVPGLTPDEFVRKVIAARVKHDMNGKLVMIGPKYRREAGA